MRLQEAIVRFTEEIAAGRIEVYNEFSVQFELAMFLRGVLPAGFKVQLERNVEYFGLDKKLFTKKEMDIVVFSEDKSRRGCIEIKYPTNGQHPEQMFKIAQDVGFLEELADAGFSPCFSLVFSDDPIFFSGRSEEGIYQMFRVERVIRGTIQKPTGERDEIVHLRGQHPFEWRDLREGLRCFLIEV